MPISYAACYKIPLWHSAVSKSPDFVIKFSGDACDGLLAICACQINGQFVLQFNFRQQIRLLDCRHQIALPLQNYAVLVIMKWCKPNTAWWRTNISSLRPETTVGSFNYLLPFTRDESWKANIEFAELFRECSFSVDFGESKRNFRNLNEVNHRQVILGIPSRRFVRAEFQQKLCKFLQKLPQTLSVKRWNQTTKRLRTSFHSQTI